ncbi:MAG: archaellin/type IV pilin N-terminal domain-containing protein [Anaerolineae bacterium]
MSSRKGVSEIVAVILMILIVTTIGFGIFLYSLGYFSNITSAYVESSKLDSDAVREKFVVTDVLFTVSPGSTTVRVALYNYGQTNLRVVALYVNGSALGSLVAESIPPYGWGYATGVLEREIPSDAPQLVRVVSKLGNYYENYYFSG